MTLPGLGETFAKNATGEQLFVWGVLQALISALIAPELQTLAQLSFETDPSTVLSPAEVATAINRAFLTPDEGAGEAKASGIDSARLKILTDLAGDAPAPGDLATALRRGLIPQAGRGPDAVTFEQGISEGNLRDKWTDVMRELAIQWPTPADALDALLEGQVSDADGRALYEKFGGAPQYFDMLFNTRGSAPTPVEALTMANRGLIPWDGQGPGVTSFLQAFLEGPWRNKWEPAYRKLGEYFPPPRTITAMYKEGSLTHDQAVSYLEKQGLPADLAAAYVQSGNAQAAETGKDLTEASVISMFEARLIPQADAEAFLEALKYSPENAKLLIELADLRRSIAAVNTAVSRVRTLFVSHKITEAAAAGVLNALQVPAGQVTEIIGTWRLEAAVNVKLLTEAQIADAFAYKILTEAEALAELRGIGYTALDAWTVLSIKNKAPLPGKPAAGPNPVGTIP